MPEAIFLQFGRLGDCVQSTVLIATWRARHSEDKIIVLTSPAFAPVFYENPDIDELMLCDPPGDNGKTDETRLDAKTNRDPPLIQSLKQRKFRSVVNLTHDLFGRRLAAELQCEILLGFAADAEGKPVADDPWSLYLLSFLGFRQLNLLNLVDLYAQLSGGAAVRNTPHFVIDDKCRCEIAQWLHELQPAECFVGFQPGANKPERRWPAENFVQLGRELVSHYNVQILVFGSRDEELPAKNIADQIPNARCFAGKTSVSQLAALLEKCKVLVTNDTGTMHLAAAVGASIVALFESSAYFRETGPYGSGHWIIQSRQLLEYGDRTDAELRMMQRIPVKDVLTAVDTFLSHSPSNHSIGGADHYRSYWTNGTIDFLPAVPVPMKTEDLCARFQKPIWLASLNGRDVNPDQAAQEALAILKKYYTESSTLAVPETLEQFLKDAQQTEVLLLRLRDFVDLSLQKLRKNPAYRFSQDQLSKITSQEKEIMQSGRNMAVHPFVTYFDTALALVKGTNTRELFQNYRRHVIFLGKQLKALQAVVRSAQSKWELC
jgi:ADP-heptose:LPS heptosyltransferase